jgi:PTS system mannitol-specific IIA component
MHEREKLASTYMGNMLAIPHGTDDSKTEVYQSGISIIIYDKPIKWDGNDVRLIIGIAGKGDEHLELLSRVAIICSDVENINKVLRFTQKEDVLRFFSTVSE